MFSQEPINTVLRQWERLPFCMCCSKQNGVHTISRCVHILMQINIKIRIYKTVTVSIVSTHAYNLAFTLREEHGSSKELRGIFGFMR